LTEPGIRLFVPGDPVPKGRPRAFRMGRARIGHYTPKKTRDWETEARRIARIAMRSRDPLEVPVRLEVMAVFAAPESWPRWKRSLVTAERIFPTSRNDMDNVVKAVSDALNGVVWLDDSLVVDLVARKRYGSETVPPGVYAAIVPLAGRFGSQLQRRPEIPMEDRP
jgi:Holliday junction resolvase RusA-like endonuclease